MTFTDLNAQALGGILECTLYGAYVVLFTLYLVLQRRNDRGFGRRPLTLAQILLFGLCTLSFFLDVVGDYLSVVVPDLENLLKADKINFGSLVIFAIIDYLAQMILLYRCWIIWDRRWVVVAVPGFLALVTLGGGFALAGLYNSSLWKTDEDRVIRLFQLTGIATNSISLSVNALTTLLIVTKILLTAREVRAVLGSNSDRSIRIATAMLIESGLLMFAFQLVFVVLYYRVEFDVISNAVTQTHGITPTLLNIRVAMGTAYDKTTEKTRTLRFAHSGGVVTGPSTSTAGVQSQGIITELDCVSNSERTTNDAV